MSLEQMTAVGDGTSSIWNAASLGLQIVLQNVVSIMHYINKKCTPKKEPYKYMHTLNPECIQHEPLHVRNMGMTFIHIFLPEELCAPILLQLIAVAMTLLGMPVLRDCISHHAHMVITHVIGMPVGNHALTRIISLEMRRTCLYPSLCTMVA